MSQEALRALVPKSCGPSPASWLPPSKSHITSQEALQSLAPKSQGPPPAPWILPPTISVHPALSAWRTPSVFRPPPEESSASADDNISNVVSKSTSVAKYPPPVRPQSLQKQMPAVATLSSQHKAHADATWRQQRHEAEKSCAQVTRYPAPFRPINLRSSRSDQAIAPAALLTGSIAPREPSLMGELQTSKGHSCPGQKRERSPGHVYQRAVKACKLLRGNETHMSDEERLTPMFRAYWMDAAIEQGKEDTDLTAEEDTNLRSEAECAIEEEDTAGAIAEIEIEAEHEALRAIARMAANMAADEAVEKHLAGAEARITANMIAEEAADEHLAGAEAGIAASIAADEAAEEHLTGAESGKSANMAANEVAEEHFAGAEAGMAASIAADEAAEEHLAGAESGTPANIATDEVAEENLAGAESGTSSNMAPDEVAEENLAGAEDGIAATIADIADDDADEEHLAEEHVADANQLQDDADDWKILVPGLRAMPLPRLAAADNEDSERLVRRTLSSADRLLKAAAKDLEDERRAKMEAEAGKNKEAGLDQRNQLNSTDEQRVADPAAADKPDTEMPAKVAEIPTTAEEDEATVLAKQAKAKKAAADEELRRSHLQRHREIMAEKKLQQVAKAAAKVAKAKRGKQDSAGTAVAAASAAPARPALSAASLPATEEQRLKQALDVRRKSELDRLAALWRVRQQQIVGSRQ